MWKNSLLITSWCSLRIPTTRQLPKSSALFSMVSVEVQDLRQKANMQYAGLPRLTSRFIIREEYVYWNNESQSLINMNRFHLHLNSCTSLVQWLLWLDLLFKFVPIQMISPLLSHHGILCFRSSRDLVIDTAFQDSGRNGYGSEHSAAEALCGALGLPSPIFHESPDSLGMTDVLKRVTAESPDHTAEGTTL